MKHKEHRLGVSEVNLVTRHLGLKRPINTEKLTEAIAEIDQLYGLDDIAFVETSSATIELASSARRSVSAPPAQPTSSIRAKRRLPSAANTAFRLPRS